MDILRRHEQKDVSRLPIAVFSLIFMAEESFLFRIITKLSGGRIRSPHVISGIALFLVVAALAASAWLLFGQASTEERLLPKAEMKLPF